MQPEDNFRLTVVLGPTASGKTRYAVRMAALTDSEIISADSRQVYHGMDIGTGKDLADYVWEGRRVPYHLIDIADAGEKYDVYRYQRDFATAYRQVTASGRKAILCGGTGLYIEAVTRNYYIPSVPANPELRQQLETLPQEELERLLLSLTTPHNVTDFDTRKRLIRAIEIALYRNEHPQEDVFEQVEPVRFSPDQVRYIGLSVSRDERNARIDSRLEARLQEGMVEEVQGLLDRGIPPEDLIYYGLEYKFVTLYLTGQLTYNEMVERLKIAIHQFAKRQMTWFRGMERRGIHIEWVTASGL